MFSNAYQILISGGEKKGLNFYFRINHRTGYGFDRREMH